MAIKKNQLSGGGEIGEVVKKNSRLSRFKVLTSSKKRLAILLVGIVVALVAIIWGYGELRSSTQKTNEETYTDAFTKSNDSDATKSRLVDQYGQKYDTTYAEVKTSNPANWDKAMLDKACIVLLYADKMNAQAQVYAVLSMMELAKARGLNIDDNSYGVNQGMRDAILQRAKAQTDKANSEASKEKE